jgi:hypothetical protein
MIAQRLRRMLWSDIVVAPQFEGSFHGKTAIAIIRRHSKRAS